MASTRAESYEYPGALPKVEHAGIRSDLARRDFTINAMAVSLKPETFGDLFDYFGGREDLEAGRIVVLHNLSFIEDPTRILRAIRYESRYGLRMDEHTLNLARACCAMDLVGDLSSARLRDELVSLLDEEKVDFALRRAEELGVWPAIHGRLRVDARHARGWCAAPTSCARRTGLEREAPRWRLRLVWLLRDLDPEEIAAWAVRMRVRSAGRLACSSARSSSAGASSTGSRAGRARPSCTTSAAGEPLEAVLAAMTLDDSGIAADRLAHFLDVTRHVRLDIGGDDLLELGFSLRTAPGRGAAQRAAPQAERRRRRPRRGTHGRGQDARARVNDSSLLVQLPHHLAAAPRQPRAARAGARLGRLPAGRPDGQGARAAHAQPDQAPRHVGHHHAGRHVPGLRRQLLLRLGQARAGRPALLQGRAARHGLGGRRRAADQLRPRARRRRPDLARRTRGASSSPSSSTCSSCST